MSTNPDTWSAAITKATKNEDDQGLSFNITVHFACTNGKNFDSEFKRLINAAQADNLVNNQLAQLQVVTTFDPADLEGKVYGLLPVPEQPPEPTIEELARAKFFADLLLLQKMKAAVALGYLAQDDKAFVDQGSLVSRQWSASFIPFLGPKPQ